MSCHWETGRYQNTVGARNRCLGLEGGSIDRISVSTWSNNHPGSALLWETLDYRIFSALLENTKLFF